MSARDLKVPGSSLGSDMSFLLFATGATTITIHGLNFGSSGALSATVAGVACGSIANRKDGNFTCTLPAACGATSSMRTLFIHEWWLPQA